MASDPKTAAWRAVDDIIADLNDRRGLGIDTLDKEIQREIRKKWRNIVERATRSVLPESEGA